MPELQRNVVAAVTAADRSHPCCCKDIVEIVACTAAAVVGVGSAVVFVVAVFVGPADALSAGVVMVAVPVVLVAVRAWGVGVGFVRAVREWKANSAVVVVVERQERESG